MTATRSRGLLWAARAAPIAVLAGVLLGIAAGAAAGLLSALAVCFGFALASQLETPELGALAARLGNAFVLVLPGVLIVFFAFNGGGFFPFAPAVAAVFVAFVVLLRLAFADDPFEGLGRLALAAVALFALYAGWVFLSQAWSHAPGRAFTETSRALLYLLVLVLFASLASTGERLRWMVRVVVVAITVVCVCGLITRVLPHVWPITPNIVNNRLGYPITYWNTLGLLGAFGCVLALHLTCSLHEPVPVRLAAAAVIPVLATTVLFTFSRGAIAAAILGLAVYVLLGRPRGLVSGLIATGPATAIALVAAYHADQLSTVTPTTPRGVSQGHHVTLVVVLCVAAAVILRALCLRLDRRLLRLRFSSRVARTSRIASVGAGVVLIVTLLAIGAPHWVDRQYHRFVNPKATIGVANTRGRLTDPANNGRIDNWRVAMREFRHSKLHGDGAGTFVLAWDRDPASASNPVVNAHSVYVENLSDLGLVGFALVVGGLLTLLAGMARRTRGPGRSLYAAFIGVFVAWMFEAGLDWQWQMPVVTAILFALGGLAVARSPAGEREPRLTGPAPRAGAAAAVVALAVVPLLVGVSQAHLDDSVSSFQAEDCPAAESAARSATNALSGRPEAYQVLGWCALHDGDPARGIRELQSAVKRDPNNWEYHYSLAVMRAAAGQDPRPEIRKAEQLGPYQVLPADAADLFDSSSPRVWIRRAPTAPLPDELAS